MRKMMRRGLCLLAIVTAATAGVARAGEPNASMLVSTAWLAEHLHDPNLVLLHVGDREGFERAHLPGARLAALDTISARKSDSGLTLELLPVPMLVERLEALGISNTSRLVVYSGADWVSATARVFYTLDYVGLGERVSMLDGGQPAWVAEGRPVTADIVPPARGHLVAKGRPEIVADAEWVKSHLGQPEVVIVDSRDTKFYDGADKGSMPRGGHIPGARSIPFSSLVDDHNKLKDAATLRQLFARAGATGNQTVVTYCHIGQQATLDYFVARYLGYPAKLYDGSFEDWSRRAAWPVEPASANSAR